MKVRDVMTTKVLTIAPGAPLKEAATEMIRAGVSGLPVIDEDRKVIGIITEADFVLGFGEISPTVQGGWCGGGKIILPGVAALGEAGLPNDISANLAGDALKLLDSRHVGRVLLFQKAQM